MVWAALLKVLHSFRAAPNINMPMMAKVHQMITNCAPTNTRPPSHAHIMVQFRKTSDEQTGSFEGKGSTKNTLTGRFKFSRSLCTTARQKRCAYGARAKLRMPIEDRFDFQWISVPREAFLIRVLRCFRNHIKGAHYLLRPGTLVAYRRTNILSSSAHQAYILKQVSRGKGDGAYENAVLRTVVHILEERKHANHDAQAAHDGVHLVQLDQRVKVDRPGTSPSRSSFSIGENANTSENKIYDTSQVVLEKMSCLATVQQALYCCTSKQASA